VGSVTSRLQNVKSRCRYAYWKLLTQVLLELGVFSSTAEISDFLQYQLQVEGIVLYFWSSLDLLKVELWFVIGEFKFPQRVVVLVLESDAAYNQVKWLLCKKKYSVCLVWCYKTRGNREQDVRSLKAALSSGMTILQVMFACKKYEQGEQWCSDIAVSHTLAKPFDIQSENTRIETLWCTPLTILSIHTADNSLLHLLLLRSKSILAGCPIINISSCHQGMKLSWVGPMV